MGYYAKSKLSNGNQPTVGEHCRAVAELAEAFGMETGMANEAKFTGYFHDFGKYSSRFQNVLIGVETGINHAAGSAAFVNAMPPQIKPHNSVIEVIYSHHGTLCEYGIIETELKEIIVCSICVPVAPHAGA